MSRRVMLSAWTCTPRLTASAKALSISVRSQRKMTISTESRAFSIAATNGPIPSSGCTSNFTDRPLHVRLGYKPQDFIEPILALCMLAALLLPLSQGVGGIIRMPKKMKGFALSVALSILCFPAAEAAKRRSQWQAEKGEITGEGPAVLWRAPTDI